MKCPSCGAEISAMPRFCPWCGTSLNAEPPSATAKRSVFRRAGSVLFPLVAVAGVAVFYSYLRPSVHPVIQQQPVVTEAMDYDTVAVSMTFVPFRDDGDEIVFSLADLLRHRYIGFDYSGKTVTRPLMAYLARDGRVVTAVRLSENCGSTEFTIRSNQIYCAQCPSHWDMMTMEAYACCAKYYPDPIPSRVEGGNVRIAKSVVDQWAGRL